MEKNMEPFIPVITKHFVCRVNLKDILYITSYKRKIRLVTTEGNIEFYEQMNNMIPYMDRRFCRCLKTLCINMERVEKMEAQRIYFENGEFIPLGRDNFVRTRQLYASWLKNLIN